MRRENCAKHGSYYTEDAGCPTCWNSGQDKGYRAGIEAAAKACDKYADALDRDGDTWLSTTARRVGDRVRALLIEPGEA